MDKLALWPKGIARVLIAGVLAWALILQGMAAVASPRSGKFDVVSEGLDRCAGDADGHRHSPGPHLSCSCCIPCRTFQIDGAARLPSVLSANIVFSTPSPETRLADPSLSAKATSAVGWLSSWSSRAPPIV
jgi:hypothetical protein